MRLPLLRLLVAVVAAAVVAASDAAAAADSEPASDGRLVVLILTPGPTTYDERRAEEARAHVVRELHEENPAVVISHRALGTAEAAASWGAHAVWPLVPRIAQIYRNLRWLLVIESESRLDGRRLRERLRRAEEEEGGRGAEERFIGRGLVDEQPVITHHFYGFDADSQNGEVFQYPDLAAGALLSGTLVAKLATALEARRGGDFTIDLKHELARMIKDLAGVRLESEVDHFCQSPGGAACVVWFEQRTGSANEQGCAERPPIDHRSLFVAIKTFSGFHRTRVVVAKRTWTKNVDNVVYYSDTEDAYVPARSLGIPNTERGHCAKTIGILKDALVQPEFSTARWLLIADDDTIVGLARLYRWLRCYDDRETMIIGERYGFGYGISGEDGYDYPTGGAGMIFSPAAARLLAEKCACPADDAPDDMVIGMCARRLRIPIVHAAGLHQARPTDYARSLLARLPPLSFHKHEGVDPYEVYTRYLRESDDELRREARREEL